MQVARDQAKVALEKAFKELENDQGKGDTATADKKEASTVEGKVKGDEKGNKESAELKALQAQMEEAEGRVTTASQEVERVKSELQAIEQKQKDAKKDAMRLDRVLLVTRCSLCATEYYSCSPCDFDLCLTCVRSRASDARKTELLSAGGVNPAQSTVRFQGP